MPAETPSVPPENPIYGRRAANLQELKMHMGMLFGPHAIVQAAEFQPRQSDVIVATFPKCGTTWMEQIVHGIRSKGSMDFDDLTDLIPWLEVGHISGQDASADQPFSPRVFKTHVNWPNAPRGGRYIVVFRHPKDALLSFYHFLHGWVFEPDAISLEDFAAKTFMMGGPFGRYWEHIRSWWQHRDEDNFIFVTFEDMKGDLGGVVSRLADFIGVELDADTHALVTAQSGFDFMRQHREKFDDHEVRSKMETLLGLPSGNQPPKLRAGKVGGHKGVLPEAIEQAMDALWKQEIEEKLGFASYEEFSEHVRTYQRSR